MVDDIDWVDEILWWDCVGCIVVMVFVGDLVIGCIEMCVGMFVEF